MPKPLRWTLRLLTGLLMLLVLALIALWLVVRGSLPALEGEIALPGLGAGVQIERDGNGVASVTARDRNDMVRALGYVHAQERFFEMDLTRRAAAGELSALFGIVALPMDRERRIHRFRTRIDHWWNDLPASEREPLAIYAEGVNAGLNALRAKPWPYVLLRTSPQPWQAQDSLLVVLAMFFDLQDENNDRERRLDTARRFLHPAAYAFIARDGTPWDAPLTGDLMPEPALPSPAQLNLREHAASPPGTSVPEPELPGSNSFAVAGRLTAHGHALVANDMHLGLGVPNLWFRARLAYGQGDDTVQLDGFTLPGVPAVVVGSNGRVAWSFTNSYGDWLDLVRLQRHPDDDQRYRSGTGWHHFERINERILVKGEDDATLEVFETIWGPVIGEDVDGAPLALAWTAHRAGAVNAELMRLEQVRDVEQALAVATQAGIPAQNFVAGDRHGRIGWTLAGRIPQRRPNHDPSHPIAGAELDGDLWLGWLDPAAHPRVLDPESGRIWTANARIVGGDDLTVIGNGGYDNGVRSGQIRDGLFARAHFDERDLLAIQLDDRAPFMETWWQLLRDTLARADGSNPELAQLDQASQQWDGCACIDSISYRLARTFRRHVHTTLMDGLAAPIRARVESFQWPGMNQSEGVVRQLLRERPAHLLPPPYDDWDELLQDQAHRVVQSLTANGQTLDGRTWGEANTVRVRHPLSRALPAFIARHLDMPVQPLPGDGLLPRVQGPQFGASQRMVVAPGREAHAIGHMPGGQSGHPWSPYYGAGHDDWAQGLASPLPPGQSRWRLRLFPAH